LHGIEGDVRINERISGKEREAFFANHVKDEKDRYGPDVSVFPEVQRDSVKRKRKKCVACCNYDKGRREESTSRSERKKRGEGNSGVL